MRIVFMGTPNAAAASLKTLIDSGHDVAAVYTQPDRPSGRGNKITFSPVKELALIHKINVEQPLKIKTDEAFEAFSSFDADVAVVVAYGRILPAPFLNAFRFGAINVHFSLLPKYRGAAPVNWAIANGEKKSGVTTIKMDAGLDTGDILVQREVEIGDSENADELLNRLAVVGGEVLSETLENIDGLAPKPQDDSEASFAPILKRSDGLIDWTLTAESLRQKVRGFQPFPSSFSFLDGKRLTVWNCEVAPESTFIGSGAGSIVEAKGDNFIIECGGGTFLAINEVQIEGRRRMSVREFFSGNVVQAGGVLVSRI